MDRHGWLGHPIAMPWAHVHDPVLLNFDMIYEYHDSDDDFEVEPQDFLEIEEPFNNNDAQGLVNEDEEQDHLDPDLGDGNYRFDLHNRSSRGDRIRSPSPRYRRDQHIAELRWNLALLEANLAHVRGRRYRTRTVPTRNALLMAAEELIDRRRVLSLELLQIRYGVRLRGLADPASRGRGRQLPHGFHAQHNARERGLRGQPARAAPHTQFQEDHQQPQANNEPGPAQPINIPRPTQQLAPEPRRGRNEQGRVPRPGGLSPDARQRLQAQLAEQRALYEQLRRFGDDQPELRAEIHYLEDVLAGRFAGALGGNDDDDTDDEDDDGESQENEYPPYHGPALSEEDPRLPPAGQANTETITLFDAEGPRYMLKVVLDNPASSAVDVSRETIERGRQAFSRYEAPAYTIIENAEMAGALEKLNDGPRGEIWAIPPERVDIVGALMKLNTELDKQIWSLLGVGEGGTQGIIFMLRVPMSDEELGLDDD